MLDLLRKLRNLLPLRKVSQRNSPTFLSSVRCAVLTCLKRCYPIPYVAVQRLTVPTHWVQKWQPTRLMITLQRLKIGWRMDRKSCANISDCKEKKLFQSQISNVSSEFASWSQNALVHRYKNDLEKMLWRHNWSSWGDWRNSCPFR